MNFYLKNQLKAFSCKCAGNIKKRKIRNKETLEKKYVKFFWVLFVDLEISNLSQRIQTQNNHCFWDTLIRPLRNVGSQSLLFEVMA